MIMMAKSQAKAENKAVENMEVARALARAVQVILRVAEQSITTNGQY